MFAIGTGLSYKPSKNLPHLTEFKDFIDSFQFEFYVVYFELIIVYVARNYRPVRIFPVRAYSINFKNIPCIIARRVLTLPVIELSRIDRY